METMTSDGVVWTKEAPTATVGAVPKCSDCCKLVPKVERYSSPATDPNGQEYKVFSRWCPECLESRKAAVR